MKTLPLLFLAILLFCCARSEKKTWAENKVVEQKSEKFENHVPEQLLTISDTVAEDNLKADLEVNLFGRFFSGRAEFFIIDQPSNKLYNTSVKSITMYYLDGQLCKTRYVTHQTLLDTLVDTYGKFNIMGYDIRNRNLLKEEQILLRMNGTWVINKKFTNYQLTWKLPEKEIKMRVDFSNVKEPYQYIEKLNNYDKLYKDVELTMYASGY